MVLLSAQGMPLAEIAEVTFTSADRVPVNATALQRRGKRPGCHQAGEGAAARHHHAGAACLLPREVSVARTGRARAVTLPALTCVAPGCGPRASLLACRRSDKRGGRG